MRSSERTDAEQGPSKRENPNASDPMRHAATTGKELAAGYEPNKKETEKKYLPKEAQDKDTYLCRVCLRRRVGRTAARIGARSYNDDDRESQNISSRHKRGSQ